MTAQPQSLKDIGAIRPEFLKAAELNGIPLAIVGAVMRFDQGNPDERISAGWVYDFYCVILDDGEKRGANGVLSLRVRDSRGIIIQSRKKIFDGLRAGIVAPVTMNKGPNQTDFANLIEFTEPFDWHTLSAGLTLEPRGVEIQKSLPSGAPQDAPKAIQESQDDLPF